MFSAFLEIANHKSTPMSGVHKSLKEDAAKGRRALSFPATAALGQPGDTVGSARFQKFLDLDIFKRVQYV